MFHILTNVQNDESKSLLEPIDNRHNNLRVGLRSITYTVGWFNVEENQEFICLLPPSDENQIISENDKENFDWAWTRTRDLWITVPALYPSELSSPLDGGGPK